MMRGKLQVMESYLHGCRQLHGRRQSHENIRTQNQNEEIISISSTSTSSTEVISISSSETSWYEDIANIEKWLVDNQSDRDKKQHGPQAPPEKSTCGGEVKPNANDVNSAAQAYEVHNNNTKRRRSFSSDYSIDAEEATTSKKLKFQKSTSDQTNKNNNISAWNSYRGALVHSNGENVPPPIESFENSGIHSKLLRFLSERVHYAQPTPVQQHLMPIIMKKRDAIVCSQTGSGKTAGYLLPVVDHILKTTQSVKSDKILMPIAIILAPTVDLSNQVYAYAKQIINDTNIKCCVLNSSISINYQRKLLQRGNYHIVVATIERLMYFARESVISFKHINNIIIDEADFMLDRRYKATLDELMTHKSLAEARNIAMVSSTMPHNSLLIAKRYLNNAIVVEVGEIGAACKGIEQRFCETPSKRKKYRELLKACNSDDRILLFVEKREQTDILMEFLHKHNIDSLQAHGKMTARERANAWDEFAKGDKNILITTGMASRGLDFQNVSHVINFDLPKNISEYINRIGRTARLGNIGVATSFFDAAKDSDLGPNLVKCLKQVCQEIPDFLRCFDTELCNPEFTIPPPNNNDTAADW